MDKESKRTILIKKNTNKWPKTNETMLSITSHQKNANQDRKDVFIMVKATIINRNEHMEIEIRSRSDA